MRVALWLVVVLVASGCIPHMHVVRPGGSIPGDKVLLVGRMDFVPHLTMRARFGADPAGFMRRMNLLFTFDPNTPLDANYRGADLYLASTPGQPFSVAAPRRKVYLRAVFAVVDSSTDWTGSGREVTLYHAACPTMLELDPKPEDQAIYIGVISCHWSSPGREVYVHDEWPAVSDDFKDVLGPRTVTPRFPQTVPTISNSAPR